MYSRGSSRFHKCDWTVVFAPKNCIHRLTDPSLAVVAYGKKASLGRSASHDVDYTVRPVRQLASRPDAVPGGLGETV